LYGGGGGGGGPSGSGVGGAGRQGLIFITYTPFKPVLLGDGGANAASLIVANRRPVAVPYH
jgi:hypothetical protein